MEDAAAGGAQGRRGDIEEDNSSGKGDGTRQKYGVGEKKKELN